jgi:hypothetical protein
VKTANRRGKRSVFMDASYTRINVSVKACFANAAAENRPMPEDLEPMDNDEPPLTPAKMLEAKIRVLERMVEAGWIDQLARHADGRVSFQPTPTGHEVLGRIRELVAGFDNDEVAAFALFCKRYGGEHSAR